MPSLYRLILEKTRIYDKLYQWKIQRIKQLQTGGLMYQSLQ